MDREKRKRPQPEPRHSILVGDIAPPCNLPSLDGATIDLQADSVAGNPLVIIFSPKFSASVRRALAAFDANRENFKAVGARLFVVTPAAATAAADPVRAFTVLLDTDGKVFRDFGAARYDMPTTFVLRPNHHVTAILDGSPEHQMQDALSVVNRLAEARQSIEMGPHPPVLMIPDVLSKDDCQHLVRVFETRGQTFIDPGQGMNYLGTDYKMRIPEHMREDRIDHWIFDEDTMAFLQRRLQRVWPEIRKAFQYNVTKQEALRIGCYQGSRRGHLHGHRDDVAPTTYRRFAMSINLNLEEFEGGELRFPEFGDQRYRPENGTAIIFSSSLLHEALHVTAGRRLVLLAFLFGEH
jgi:peroxiredoxin